MFTQQMTVWTLEGISTCVSPAEKVDPHEILPASQEGMYPGENLRKIVENIPAVILAIPEGVNEPSFIIGLKKFKNEV